MLRNLNVDGIMSFFNKVAFNIFLIKILKNEFYFYNSYQTKKLSLLGETILANQDWETLMKMNHINN